MNAPLDRFIPAGTTLLAPRAGLMAWTPSGTVRSDAGPDRPNEALPEDYGAIGDGDYHAAADVLKVATLEAMRQWNGGVFSFAPRLDVSIDYLAWQAALHSPVRHVIGRSDARYVLDHYLHNINSRTAVVSVGGVLDFSRLAYQADDGTNLVANGTFASAASWQNTLLTPAVPWSFGAGQASWTDGAIDDPDAHFGQFGQLVALPQGKWTVQATITLSEGASSGRYGPPYCGFAFYADQVGQGELEWPDPLAKSVTLTPGVDGVASNLKFDLEVSEAAGRTLWLTFSGGNADIAVTDVTVKPYRMNCAIWCDGEAYGDDWVDECLWRDGQIVGPGKGTGLRGMLMKSFTTGDTRCNTSNLLVAHFGTGRVFGDQAYLNLLLGGSTGECDAALDFEQGSTNAGENIRGFGHTIYNSGIGVRMAGGGINLTGTSIDYCDQAADLSDAATLTLDQYHVEGRHPATVLDYVNLSGAAPDTGETVTGGTSGAVGTVMEVIEAGAYSGSLAVAVVGTFLPSEALAFSGGATAQLLGDVVQAPAYLALSGGSQMKFGTGKFLMAGAGHRGNDYLATLETTLDVVEFGDGSWGYNTNTATGEFASGPGRVILGTNIGPGNGLLPALWSSAFMQDGFGGAGRVEGANTASDIELYGATPADGLGVIAGLWTEDNQDSRLSDLIGNKVEVIAGPAGGPDGVHGYLTCTVGPTYSGVLDFRVLLPVQPGRPALIRYAWATDASMAAVPYGPFAGGISVATNAGSSVVRITDPSCATLAAVGPQGGWTATLTGVSGNPGGIPDASLNGTHTIVERLDTNIWSIDTGVAATSSVTGAGGAGIGSSYSATNWFVYERYFWVAVVGYDQWGRPQIGQTAFQGENNFSAPFTAPSGWATRHYNTWYAEPVIPDDPQDRTGNGRAPAWATHLALCIDYRNAIEVSALTPPTLLLGNIVGNCL